MGRKKNLAQCKKAGGASKKIEKAKQE